MRRPADAGAVTLYPGRPNLEGIRVPLTTVSRGSSTKEDDGHEHGQGQA